MGGNVHVSIVTYCLRVGNVMMLLLRLWIGSPSVARILVTRTYQANTIASRRPIYPPLATDAIIYKYFAD